MTDAPKPTWLRDTAIKVMGRPRVVLIPVIVLALGLHLLTAGALVANDLLAGVIVMVGTLVGLESEDPPYSFGLAGVADGPPAPTKVSAKVYPRVSLAAVTTFFVLQVGGLDSRWSVILGGVAAVAWLIASEAVIRRVWHTRKLAKALREFAPTTALAFAGRSGGPWQLRMWEPYLLRSGERTVIFSLHEKYREMILAGGDLESAFIQLGSNPKADLDRLLVKSLRALFYVQNAQSNALFMAHKRLTHVWLNHGDSDKPANFNPRHASYDRLVVCGQAGIDRYARHGIDVAPEKFDVLGRPQASGVARARAPIGDLSGKTVFYGPTWQGLDDGVNFSSLERGPEIVRALLARGVTVVFRPHPLSYRWRIRRAVIHEIHAILKSDREESGRQHVWGKRADKTWSVVDCANAADALISDVSSVVSDFLQSEKPYAMMSMRAQVDQFRAEFAVAETGYVILGDLSNLDESLDDLLQHDPLAEARAERKRYVLGDFTGAESADAFAAYVRRLVGHTS